MWVVLWDIDHTLIDTRGIGRELSGEAFERVTGQPMREQARIDGITEAVIFRETAKLHGINATRSDFERFAQELTTRHIARGADLREHGHALPGAAAALGALAGIEDLVRIALARASEHYGTTVATTDVVLIGDTPADVAAGIATGVLVIAVASGKSTSADLKAAGANRVLPDLEDTERFIDPVRKAPG